MFVLVVLLRVLVALRFRQQAMGQSMFAGEAAKRAAVVAATSAMTATLTVGPGGVAVTIAGPALMVAVTTVVVGCIVCAGVLA